ncbi:hypothetical protein R3W88_003425 [Solanum pinnatisectum]|uniref:Uncharacterized protein n=1 Tax=Solanum pinnatisectum TaxID=50273 RepID=A0AAV9MPK3_9SOLN|nr:hypothetical protein R3W88_003425 [Solanum pinnatisectum]
MSGINDNEILALKNGSWRIIDSKTSGKTDSGLLCGGELLPFVDEAFHWVGFLSKVCVVSFNISDEIYGEISLPEIVCSELTLFIGMLGLYYKDDKDFSLWVMKKYGIEDSWMKLFTIPSVECHKIVPKYAFSDDEVLLCFDQENWVTPEDVETSYVYKKISGGQYRMISQDYDIDAVTVDWEGFACTKTLTDIKLY